MVTQRLLIHVDYENIVVLNTYSQSAAHATIEDFSYRQVTKPLQRPLSPSSLSKLRLHGREKNFQLYLWKHGYHRSKIDNFEKRDNS